MPAEVPTWHSESQKDTIIYKDSLLNTLDDKNLTFNDKIEALQKYLKDKLSNLENFDLLKDFNNWAELFFIKKANEHIETYLDQDNLDDTQKRNLIYLVSICSCYRDIVVKTLTELTEIESENEFKWPYNIWWLIINSFENLNSTSEKWDSIREDLKIFLNKYKKIKISSFSRAIRYAVEESYIKPKNQNKKSENYLFIWKEQLEPEDDDKPQEKK